MTKTVIPADNRRPKVIQVARMLMAAFPGKPLVIEVGPWKKPRSNPQNAYLFGVAYEMLRAATGMEVNAWHEYFCGEYFGWVDKPVPESPKFPDGIERVPRRTTTTNEEGKRDVIGTEEFMEFTEAVRREGAQHGLVIPDPDPLHFLRKAA